MLGLNPDNSRLGTRGLAWSWVQLKPLHSVPAPPLPSPYTQTTGQLLSRNHLRGSLSFSGPREQLWPRRGLRSQAKEGGDFNTSHSPAQCPADVWIPRFFPELGRIVLKSTVHVLVLSWLGGSHSFQKEMETQQEVRPR